MKIQEINGCITYSGYIEFEESTNFYIFRIPKNFNFYCQLVVIAFIE